MKYFSVEKKGKPAWCPGRDSSSFGVAKLLRVLWKLLHDGLFSKRIKLNLKNLKGN